MTDLSSATRPILWNISGAWVMYLLLGIALVICGYGVYRHVSFWRRGKPNNERFGDWGKRAWTMIKEVLFQKRVRGSRFPGLFHSLVFYSFIVLTITTAVVFLDADFGTTFFRGYVYVLLTVGAEVAGVFVLVGAGMAAWRRLISKPKTIENKWGDATSLSLIALIVLTGFVIEGLRIAVIGDPWAPLSFVGWACSGLFGGISEEAGSTTHRVLWWTHTVLAMTWIATIPFTKFFHLLAVPTNNFFAKLNPRGELKHVDLEAMMEAEDFDEASFNIGTGNAEQFTWKQRLDFDACINCGRCEEICPALMAGHDFSPKRLIQKSLELCHAYDKARAQAKKAPDAQKTPDTQADSPAEPIEQAQIIGAGFDEEFIWYCRTCTACMEVCPAAIDHVDTFMDIRRNEIMMQGRVPGEAARALRMLSNLGNPFGPQGDRVEWIDKLGVRVVGPGEKVDVLYWIGCCTTFDPTKQNIAVNLCELMKRCGIDFGVLGRSERCCGDPARVLGDENIFQEIAKQQIADLNSREFRVLLVSCPHCYNVLAHEYKPFGGNYNVVHHSEFLHEMVWSGRIKPEQGPAQKIVYHDPCYLGRYQKIFDAPREVLHAIPGTTLTEMNNMREKSLCCGGGGGHFWMDLKSTERINNLRVQQALEKNADCIVTGCAYCVQMLEDSVKIMDVDDRLRVMDIATFVRESLPEEEVKSDSPADSKSKAVA
ncbi:MAG: respiratory nitrate reductase subunit gamma [Bradymonadales bacterium]|nr:respiratory nitrate reductase subunit gamma [Bradymonadales bacterium]